MNNMSFDIEKEKIAEIEAIADMDTENIQCQHYGEKRKCNVFCDVCQKYFPCRICHDDILDYHKFNRFDVKKMKCRLCQTEQDVSSKCSECEEDMAKYYCSICHLFSDDSETGIIHCDKCGICRVGSDVIHCDNCCMCINTSNFEGHICREGMYNYDCPICMEDMNHSTIPIFSSECSHSMHSTCYREYVMQGSYKCPLCNKTMYDATPLWNIIEQYVNTTEMPEEYQDKTSDIICNDCQEKSNVPFHFMYHKCPNCNSWNTDLV